MAYYRNNQTNNWNQQTISSNQQNINQALQALQKQQASKPGQYQSEWQAQINEMLDKIMNREKFSYDLNGDALYQQYKDQYTVQGQQAMMDTMGQAQAMTGGYGNSYAQTVGQQVYQGYMQQLGDKIPELYQMALNQYNQEGQNMLNQYGLMMDQENQDYGRYRDTVSDYQTELDRLLSQYYTERDFGYQQDRDKVSDEQWQKQYDESVRQWQAEFDEALRRYNEEKEAASKTTTTTKKATTPTTPTSTKDAYTLYKEALAQGYGNSAAKNALAAAGFSNSEINAAMDKYEEEVIKPLSKPVKQNGQVM